ncbi:MAG: DUF2975 domain-containing protein [Alphaproteobacteria bacterium]|nr:DUF2975 domain-containing protein [Alphaproteobacteria bacterium]
MQRIQKVSTYLIWVFNFLLITYPLFIASRWFLIDWEPFKNLVREGLIFTPIAVPEGSVNLADVAFTPLTKMIWLTGNLIGFAPLFLGLLILKTLFTNYKSGIIFSLQNAEKYKYIGGLFLINAFLTAPLSQMFDVLTVTLSNPPGHRYITLSFGTPNIEAIFCGILILCISWVMAEGYKLQEEQSLII